ncbi:MAG TPA: 16S rRNA (guanine(527)-N(7))-methyltransferase RsmG [Salinivirgaceae bacterium]|nr:16S rRNA (guanine(527)-N(7))-methyltransferase RsmG [Salinivirgaceae bacterium]
MEILLQYFPNLTDTQQKQFKDLETLVKSWNEKINLISRKDIANVIEHHILHSLAIAKIISFEPQTTIVDIGTGGGFPGLPLALFFPNIDFYLIDSIGKKIAVVNDIISKLGLSNVKAEQTRAENLKLKFDFVVSRAVTDIPTFVKFSRHLVSDKQRNAMPNGIFYLKGGNFSTELKQLKTHVELFDIHSMFKTEYFKEKKVVYIPF